LALRHDIRVLIKDDESRRAASRFVNANVCLRWTVDIRTYVVPQSRLPTNSLSLKADMVVVHQRVRKWENREKTRLGHMNDVDHMITTSKGILLKRNHMSCQLNADIALAE
jgi:hypothetical protein